MRHTIADAATAWGLEKELARGLVKVLVEIEQATNKGERKPENGRGRAEDVFEFEEGYEEALAKFLVKGKLT